MFIKKVIQICRALTGNVNTGASCITVYWNTVITLSERDEKGLLGAVFVL